MDTIDQARAQLQASFREIQELSRRVQYLHAQTVKLRQFIELGEEIRRSQVGGRADIVVEAVATPAIPILPQDLKTTKDKVIWACGQILADGKPRHIRELLTLLKEKNIEVGGKDKVLAVSAILSSDKRFKASRKVGWSLVDQKARLESAPTDSSLFSITSGRA